MIAIFHHLSAKCNFRRRYSRNKIFSRNHFNRQSSSATRRGHDEDDHVDGGQGSGWWLTEETNASSWLLRCSKRASRVVAAVQQSAELTISAHRGRRRHRRINRFGSPAQAASILRLRTAGREPCRCRFSEIVAAATAAADQEYIASYDVVNGPIRCITVH